MRTKRCLTSILLCSVFLYMGCTGKTKSTEEISSPATEDVDAGEVDEPKMPQDEGVALKPNSATLLLDASVSMKGYLNASDSRFVGVISFFETMPNTIKNCLFGTSESNPVGALEFEKQLDGRRIEWSHESDLKAMVRSMVSHVNKGNDVCFLVTDGILSGSNEQIKNSPDRSYNIIKREQMSNELSSLFMNYADKLSALIVNYKAKFNGTYSCYNNDGKKLINKERPFYVIAVGKWGSIKYLEEKLNEAKKQNGITTPYEDIIMIGDARSYQQIKLTAAKGLNPKDGILVIKRENRNESIILSANLDKLPAYMQTEGYMKANIELLVKHGLKTEKSLGKDYYEVSVNETNGKPLLSLSIKATQLKDSKLIFKLKYALPEWIEQKNDDNDLDIASNPTKLGKTFNLKYFVAGFTALHKGEYIKEQTLEFK